MRSCPRIEALRQTARAQAAPGSSPRRAATAKLALCGIIQSTIYRSASRICAAASAATDAAGYAMRRRGPALESFGREPSHAHATTDIRWPQCLRSLTGDVDRYGRHAVAHPRTGEPNPDRCEHKGDVCRSSALTARHSSISWRAPSWGTCGVEPSVQASARANLAVGSRGPPTSAGPRGRLRGRDSACSTRQRCSRNPAPAPHCSPAFDQRAPSPDATAIATGTPRSFGGAVIHAARPHPRCRRSSADGANGWR